MFRLVCQHQSLKAELVSYKSAAVDLVPLTITQLAPVGSAAGKLLLWLHLIESEKHGKKNVAELRSVRAGTWTLKCAHMRAQINHLIIRAAVQSVHAVKHARGCVCPSVWVTSVRPLGRISGPADCVSLVSGRLQAFDVADGRLLSPSGLRSVARAGVGRPG